MIRISLADAKARLSEIVDRVEAGESIEITRRGKPVAKIGPTDTAKEWKPIDMALIRALHAKMPLQTESAGDFIRRMRDDARY